MTTKLVNSYIDLVTIVQQQLEELGLLAKPLNRDMIEFYAKNDGIINVSEDPISAGYILTPTTGSKLGSRKALNALHNKLTRQLDEVAKNWLDNKNQINEIVAYWNAEISKGNTFDRFYGDPSSPFDIWSLPKLPANHYYLCEFKSRKDTPTRLTLTVKAHNDFVIATRYNTVFLDKLTRYVHGSSSEGHGYIEAVQLATEAKKQIDALVTRVIDGNGSRTVQDLLEDFKRQIKLFNVT